MILVTGATGLVGSHLLFELTNNGSEVRALVRKNSDKNFVKKVFSYYSSDYERLFEKIIWAEGDITDYESLKNAFTNVDNVYHVAAKVSFKRNDIKTLNSVNIEGTANIINACLEFKIKKLCHCSSVGAIGREYKGQLTDENSPWDSKAITSAYSKSKYEAEIEVRKGIDKGLNVVIVNPSIIIGPGHWAQGSSKFFETVWKGQKFYTKGINGFVDVRDVARIMVLLTESNIKGERYIISSENICYHDLLKDIAHNLNVKKPNFYASSLLSNIVWRIESLRSRLTGKESLITRETARTAHSKHLYSNKKIIDTLNYSFIPVKEAIAHTAKTFLKEKSFVS